MISQIFFNKLSNSNNNIPKFTFKNRILPAKVISVYDGDTCKVNLPPLVSSDELFQFTIRVNGYDSPEIKSTDEVEKKYAIIAKQVLSQLVLNKIVLLRCNDFDKYGRILADILVNSNHPELLDIGQYMISNKYGTSYSGGTKKIFSADLYSENILDLPSIVDITYEQYLMCYS